VSLRVLIADDEPLAGERLRRLLAGEPDVEVVGECRSGRDTAAHVRALRPDLVFLDVHMPDGDGFAALRALGGARPPVVFVTAYDEYAVRAFAVDAVDYLLKPVSRERLRQALARARDRAEPPPRGAAPPSADRLLLADGPRTRVVRAADVDFAAAEGNYVRVRAAARTYLVRDTLAALEARLGPAFCRIHRQTLVNLARVREVRRLFPGRFEVVLADGTRLRLSRRARRAFAARLAGARAPRG